MIAQILAWIFQVTGTLGVLAFLALYLRRVRPWHHDPSEHPRVREYRRFLLTLAGALAALFVSGSVQLIVTNTQPSSSVFPLIGKGLASLLSLYLLRLEISARKVRR